ncbi:MAG: tellurite resistance TerB family protein [Polyangiaceae bacterium]|nr:tellurite resistance TerB family protein [Polyangiaceae bacterium]
MRAPNKSLLERVARSIRRPPSVPGSGTASVLAQAAAAYSARPVIDESDGLSGFDPHAAALFEAVVEAAYLVANADGVFDDEERSAFQSIVASACDNLVQLRQLEALTADFRELLAEDGLEKRARMVARTISDRDQQLEVLWIAALMAHVSGGVSDEERTVLAHLAQGFSLDDAAVTEAIERAALALDLG